MFRTIKSSFLLLLSFCFVLLSCQKEYSTENGDINGGGTSGGTSVYTLVGSPSTCTSPFLNGNYTAGVAMTSANSVMLAADVTKIGTYTVSSGSANGVTFSGTGTFTTTGLQFITLTATGAPANAGTFNYTPGINGCSFPVIFNAPGGGGTSSGSAVFKFDGAPNACITAIVNGTFKAGIALDASNTVTINVTVTTAGTYTITTGTANGFSFSRSGTLALGPQTITLSGIGTPAAAGTNNFTPGTNGCSFAVTTLPAGTLTVDFLKATISGLVTRFNADTTATLNNQTAGPSELYLDGFLSSTANDELSIDFFNVTGLITTGTYGSFSLTNQNKFAEISYVDNAGVTYQHNPLTAGTTVTLTTLTATGATGTFSGTLNSFDPVTFTFGTGTKVITGGTFSVHF